MRAFVTGATGLLGSNLIAALLAADYEVKGLVRSLEKARRVFPNDEIEFVSGDMSDVSAFSPALKGCDVLFHTAAYFREYYQPGDHQSILEKINVQGTVDLLLAAEKNALRKAIHISSAGVIGMKANGGPGDENTLPDELSTANLYFSSKVSAELAIGRFLRERTLPVVMVLPGWIWGPGDWAPTGSGQLVLDFLDRKLPGIIDGGASIVDVRDLARACVAAVDRGHSGERYIVGGHFFDFEQILAILEKVSGIPAPRRRIPYPLLLVAAAASQTWSRFSGNSSLVTVEAVKTMHARRSVVSDKSIRELNVAFRPFEDTVRDEIAWFRAHPH